MYNKITRTAAQKLTVAEIHSAISTHLPQWTYLANDQAIQRQHTLNNFEQTWAFLNTVAMRSHLWGHHPTITTTYNKVTITLTTHDLQGITDIDIKLAKKIEGYISNQ